MRRQLDFQAGLRRRRGESQGGDQLGAGRSGKPFAGARRIVKSNQRIEVALARLFDQ
jgi:hypothetical protein